MSDYYLNRASTAISLITQISCTYLEWSLSQPSPSLQRYSSFRDSLFQNQNLQLGSSTRALSEQARTPACASLQLRRALWPRALLKLAHSVSHQYKTLPYPTSTPRPRVPFA